MYDLYTRGGFLPFQPTHSDWLSLRVVITCSEEICSIQIAISRIVVVVVGVPATGVRFVP